MMSVNRKYGASPGFPRFPSSDCKHWKGYLTPFLVSRRKKTVPDTVSRTAESGRRAAKVLPSIPPGRKKTVPGTCEEIEFGPVINRVMY